MKRTALALTLISALFFSLPTGFLLVNSATANFAPVLPSDNIIIEADGTVVGTNKIVRNGNTYTFVGNVSGTKTVQVESSGNTSSALAIHRSNIIIDGAGYTLQCNNLTGIDISNGVCKKPSEQEIWNVTVRNLKITNFTQGINCEFGGNHTFFGNYISNDYVNQNGTGFAWDNLGIALWGSTGNTISHCTVGGSPAIYMHFVCSNNVVTRNNIVFGAHLAMSGIETFDTNYWSDYLAKFPNASEIDYSGTWNTPYVIVDSQDENSIFQDNPPLKSPQDIPIFSTVLPILKTVQEPVFPIVPIAVATLVAVVVATVVVVYLKKRKRKAEVS
jgi:hypothetical protein